MDDRAPIGVFDSGVGGLTVLRAMRGRLPRESMIYLGDTARVPYGTKSPASVLRYAEQASTHLIDRGVKLLVVACNTASALALDPLAERLAPLPVVGVVSPGAAAAVERSLHRHHLVLATESTVREHAYARAIRDLTPDARVEEIACSILVALAEEGWTEGRVAEAVVREYLAPLLARPKSDRPDTIVLGCTHFPLLAPAIRAVVGPDPVFVDSGTTTAESVARILERTGTQTRSERPGMIRILATDGAARFAALGARFLGDGIESGEVEVVDL